MGKSFKYIVLTGCLLVSSIAFSSTSLWMSSANIEPNCVVSPAALNFGVVSVLSMVPQTDANVSFPVTCTVGTPYTIQLGPGQNFNDNMRNLANGEGRVSYNLYTNASYGTVWGDGVNGSVVTGMGTGVEQSYDVFGRINLQAFNANPNNSVGTYMDMVNITVDF